MRVQFSVFDADPYADSQMGGLLSKMWNFTYSLMNTHRYNNVHIDLVHKKLVTPSQWRI